MVLGPARALGGNDPSSIPGVVGYWDARDLTLGAVTYWPPRVGAIGNLAGTGTAITSTGHAAVSQPRFVSTNAVGFSTSMTSSSPKAFFFVGKAYIMGQDNRALHLINVSAPGDTAANRSGMWWYNWSGNVLKILGNSTDTAAGISQLSINTRYLLIVNHWTGTSGTAYTWGQDGSSTTIVSQTWNNTTAKVCVGKTQSAQTNEMLDGEVSACGVYDRNFTPAEIISLREWANLEFGVVN